MRFGPAPLAGPPAEDEAAALKRQAEALETSLAAVRRRLENFERAGE
jgi:hypothetical protein